MDNFLHTFPSVSTAVVYGNRGVIPSDVKKTIANMPLNKHIQHFYAEEFVSEQVENTDLVILHLNYIDSNHLVGIIQKAANVVQQGILSFIPADESILAEYIQLGCRVFCSPNDTSAELYKAYEWLLTDSSGTYVSPVLLLHIMEARKYIAELQLSEAEMRVLRLSLHPTKIIAKKLDISEGTVRNYITKLIQKIGEPVRANLLDTFHRKLHNRVQQTQHWRQPAQQEA